MALDFTGASTYRVDHGTLSTLDNLDPVTILMWVYPTSLGVSIMADKRESSGGGYRLFYLSDGSGSFDYLIDRATDDCAVQSSTSVVTTDAWQFIGGTLDTSGANADQKLFHGTLTSLVAEPSYENQQAGSGNVNSDNSDNQYIGNRRNFDVAFSGYIAWAGIWNRQLTLGEVQAQQFRPHPTSGCVLFSHYGFNGTGTQPDWSGNGNGGTVTGATQTAHVPLAPPFAISIPWVPAPAAGASDLSVNVSDNIDVSESVTVTLPDPLAVSVSDSADLSETVKLLTVSFVTASDDATVTDAVSVEVSAPQIIVQDNVTAQDYLWFYDSGITATDSAIVSTEVVDPQISVQDDATITDAISVTVSAPQIAASDDATIADTASVSIVSAADLIVNVSDDVTLADAATADIQLDISVSDDLTISDTVVLATSAPQITIADNVTIADTVTADVVIEVTASDNATIADSTTVTVSDPQIISSDNVTIADSTGVSIIDAGAVGLSVSDDATVTDAITISVSAPAIGASDSVDVSDSATVEIIAAALGVDISYDNLDAWVRGVRVTA